MQQGREKKYLVNPLIAWKAGKHTHTHTHDILKGLSLSTFVLVSKF